MDETQQAFRQARQSFLAGLPHDEKSAFEKVGSCLTHTDLLQSLEQLCNGFAKDQGARIFRKISSFSDSLEVYFKVIDTVVSSHPEIAAIIWGAARFIFQLASNYSTFFQKLASLVEELNVVLPRFKDLLCLEKDLSLTQRLRSTVARFYGDLLDFFRDVLSIFRRKDGRTKTKGLIAMTLLWQPFDVRFGNIISRMQQHRRVVAEETAYLILSRVQQTYQLQSQHSASSVEWRKTIEQHHEYLKTILKKDNAKDDRGDDDKGDEIDDDSDDVWPSDLPGKLVSEDPEDLARWFDKLYMGKDNKRSSAMTVELSSALNQYRLLTFALRSLKHAGKDELKTILQDSALDEKSMMFQLSETLKHLDQKTSTQLRDDLEIHQNILEDIVSKFSKFSDESATRHVIQFIDPPEFMQELENSCHQRHGGTGRWFLDTKDFASWINSKGTNMLWVQGKPGMGKSTLAGLVIEELRQSEHPGQEKGTSYFFFRAGHIGLTSVDSCSRALLAQMLKDKHCGPALAEAASLAMFSKDHAQLRAPPAVIYDLLALGCRKSFNRQFIIDGLDECSDPDDKISRFLGILQTAHVKTMIFSRPSMECLRRIAEGCRLIVVPLSTQKIGEDISTYSQTCIKDFIDAKLLPRDDIDVDSLVALVTRGANGMFLWVRLLFKYLQSSMLAPPHIAPRVRLQHIKSLKYPETLDQMYHRIFDILGKAPDYQQDLARRVFKWLLFRKATLDALQLHDVLNSSYVNETTNSMQAPVACVDPELYDVSAGFEEFKESIIVACSSLVELTSTVRTSYCFVHHSVAEYLHRRLRTAASRVNADFNEPDFAICDKEVESDLAGQCLTYLIHHLPPRPLSGNLHKKPKEQIVQTQYPFLKYASAYFSAHLSSSSDHGGCLCNQDMFNLRQKQTVALFQLFLGRKFTIMTWIEALYLLEPFPGAMLSHRRNLLAWAGGLRSSSSLHQSQSLQRDIEEFSSDISELDELWGALFRGGKCEQIWLDVTAFTKSRFLMQTRAVQYTSLAPQTLDSTNLARSSLCTVSSGSASSELLGVLSIWPSREFEQYWRQAEHTHEYILRSSHCIGWVARYQIWNINEEEPRMEHELTLTIEPTEIETQIRYFLELSADFLAKGTGPFPHDSESGKMDLHFPISVHPTKPELFSILRTIYRINTLESQGVKSFLPLWESVLLSFNWNDCLESIWNDGEPSRKRLRRSELIEYRYNIQFVEHIDGILYSDTSQIRLKPRKSQIASKLAIFELPKDRFGDDPIRPSYFLERGQLNHCFSDWTLHPSLPIMVLSAYKLRGASSIMLWHYPPGRLGADTTVATLTEWENGGFPDIKKLCFSENGDEILILCDAMRYGRTFSIKEHPVYRDALQFSKRGQSHSAPFPPHETSLIQSTSTIHSADENGLSLSWTRNNNGNEIFSNISIHTPRRAGMQISLVCQEEQLKTSQPILCLPNWRSARGVDVNVKVPSSREEKLKIIINKAAQPTYTMANENDTNLPAVVFKDQRILSTPTVVKTAQICPARVSKEPSDTENRVN